MSKIVIAEFARPRMSIFDQVNIYAMNEGLCLKNGAYYKDGRFHGSFYDVGREAGINMDDGK